jgi:hypothetical protein
MARVKNLSLIYIAEEHGNASGRAIRQIGRMRYMYGTKGAKIYGRLTREQMDRHPEASFP